MVLYLLLNYQKRQHNNKQIIYKLEIIQFSTKRPCKQEIIQYLNLDQDSNFFNAIKDIIKQINQRTLQFQNTTFIPIKQEYFSDFQARFRNKNTEIPFVLCNFIYPKDFFQKKFSLKYQSMNDLGKFFGLRYDDFDKKLLFLKSIFIKFKQQSHLSNSNYEHSLISINVFSYYQISKIDKNITRAKFYEAFLNGCIENQYEIFFINDHNNFSGTILIRMVSSNQSNFFKRLYEEYRQSIKVLQISKDNFNQVLNTNHLTFDNYSISYEKLHENPIQKRSRSREKNFFQIQNQMSAIRVRGLPFSFNERDVYKIFEYYRPMKGSVKLGYRNFRKSGEAMLAFSCEKDALSSLNEDNINIRGRYLQVRLSSHSQYENFN